MCSCGEITPWAQGPMPLQGHSDMRNLSLCLGALLLAVGCGNPDMSNDSEPAGEPGNPSRLEQSRTIPACGTVLATFEGTAAKSNGGYTGTGSSCAGNPGVYGYEYQ